MTDDPRLSAPSTLRNRGPILDALRRHVPDRGLLLEIASGTGEHAAYCAPALPGLAWQPTDPVLANCASIDAWCAGLAKVRPALALDTTADWPVAQADALLCINMIHIAPWSAGLGLLAGAARVLPPGAPLMLYGPFRRAGRPMEPGNAAFDADLRGRDPAWGLRVLEDVAAAATGFDLAAVDEMPANNVFVVFRRV